MRIIPAVVLVFLTLPLFQSAAQQKPVLSPRDSVMLVLDTNKISINYGRPSMRGRHIMGGLVPWNQVWRTGANQATHLTTNFAMVMGGVPVPRGKYTLWTLPTASGWKIILNKQTGQWGTAYDARQDLARFDATVENLPAPIDTFTITLSRTGPTSGMLALAWETTRVSVPFEKKSNLGSLSPTDSTRITLDGKEIKVTYSRPAIRGRKIWGVVVPFDSLWRTGANAATTLHSQANITVGTHPLTAGAYVLRSIPSSETLTLVISKKGATPQDDAKMPELARVAMTMKKADGQIDPFRIWLEKDGANGATLNIGWDDRSFSTPIKPSK